MRSLVVNLWCIIWIYRGLEVEIMIKLQFVLAIALLLCLAPMPYGYYMLVRYGSTIILGMMAYQCYLTRKENRALIWGALAVLFQPVIKIPFGKTMWNIVDIIVAIALLLIALHTYKKK